MITKESIENGMFIERAIEDPGKRLLIVRSNLEDDEFYYLRLELRERIKELLNERSVNDPEYILNSFVSVAVVRFRNYGYLPQNYSIKNCEAN